MLAGLFGTMAIGGLSNHETSNSQYPLFTFAVTIGSAVASVYFFRNAIAYQVRDILKKE